MHGYSAVGAAREGSVVRLSQSPEIRRRRQHAVGSQAVVTVLGDLAGVNSKVKGRESRVRLGNGEVLSWPTGANPP